MFEMLENLRQKPESHRRKVAVIVPSVAVGLMAIIWVATFSVQFPDLTNSSQNQAAAILANPDTGATDPSLQSLESTFSSGVNNFTQNVGSLSSATSSDSDNASNVVILTPDGNSQ